MGLDPWTTGAAVRIHVSLRRERMGSPARPPPPCTSTTSSTSTRSQTLLLQEGAAAAEYLDILWDVTRKPDTFEEVKHNVYDLLAALAWHFSEEQLQEFFVATPSEIFAGDQIRATFSPVLFSICAWRRQRDHGRAPPRRKGGVDNTNGEMRTLGETEKMSIVRL